MCVNDIRFLLILSCLTTLSFISNAQVALKLTRKETYDWIKEEYKGYTVKRVDNKTGHYLIVKGGNPTYFITYYFNSKLLCYKQLLIAPISLASDMVSTFDNENRNAGRGLWINTDKCFTVRSSYDYKKGVFIAMWDTIPYVKH